MTILFTGYGRRHSRLTVNRYPLSEKAPRYATRHHLRLNDSSKSIISIDSIAFTEAYNDPNCTGLGSSIVIEGVTDFCIGFGF